MYDIMQKFIQGLTQLLEYHIRVILGGVFSYESNQFVAL